MRFILWPALILMILTASLWLLGSQRKEFSVSVEIAASAEQIFPYLVTPEKMMKWNRDIKSVGALTADRTAGADQTRIVECEGQLIKFTDHVIRMLPNEYLSLQSSNSTQQLTTVYKLDQIPGLDNRSDAAPLPTADFSIGQSGSAKTVVNVTLKEANLGLGKFRAPFVNPDYDSQLTQQLGQLKQVVESELRSAR